MFHLGWMPCETVQNPLSLLRLFLRELRERGGSSVELSVVEGHNSRTGLVILSVETSVASGRVSLLFLLLVLFSLSTIIINTNVSLRNGSFFRVMYRNIDKVYKIEFYTRRDSGVRVMRIGMCEHVIFGVRLALDV